MAFRVESEKNYEFICKSLIAGGVAGMCSKTAVAPLDRIKILLQAHSEHYKHLGVFSGLREIIQREQFFALYKGNFAQMIRIFPYAATQFTSFELYKKYLGALFGKNAHIDKFLAGSAAGVTAVTLTYPLDTIRARLAFQVTGEHIYEGIIHAGITIFKEEGGLKGLYKGFCPTVIGMIPYAGFSFYSFEKFKYLCMKYGSNIFCDKCDKNTGGLVLTVPARLLCGGIAGAIAQSFSYPLDVTRRRMQLSMMNPDTHKYSAGMLKTIKLIYRENGITKGLYRGMSINYLRAIPMVSVSFTTYEIMKQVLNLDTGMKV
ncbi:solute carrier family 25 member 16-like [Hylaeus anthracinus]|uniref:solute carrier family 25 member 16-like n=1 Tax=Hylaeus anthracinus TaxID=313031 RepID=UPI0023B9BAB7|nr:solute carrier family 25 member 16-like [Hylaeus anthracinus]XP_053998553.1 solute carrier family 25 member 16-like [Hylaeus anthracinus]XP_053998554.1 solute carrier family 25 member 16-like [Hylaeus anthracinus]